MVQALGGGSCSGLSAIGGLGTFYGDAITQAQSALSTLSASQSPPGQNVIVLLSDGDGELEHETVREAPLAAPMVTQECQTAINDASAAKTAGTLIYTVAYIGGGAASSTCSDGSDSLSPCATMASIATSSAYFYSDTCPSNATGGTASLSSIFKADYVYTLDPNRV